MPGKDSSAELVLLALPHNAHTGPLEAEVEPPDAGEQRANIHTPARLNQHEPPFVHRDGRKPALTGAPGNGRS
jgi:hypothetical protein